MKKLLYYLLITLATLTLIACAGGGSPAPDDSQVEGDEGAVDTILPVITLIGGDINITQGDPYVDPGATAYDDVDGNITDRIAVHSDVNTSRVGNYTVTYDVNDSAGNSAEERVRHVIVENGWRFGMMCLCNITKLKMKSLNL